MPAQQQSENISFSQHVVYICSRFIAYSFPLFFFLVTNSFYLKTYDSAQIKITFTQMGATLLAFVWIVKILVEGKLPFSRRDLVYVAPFLAFLCSGIVVWLHTPFKAWSLEETLRRVFYVILALMALAETRSNERMTRLWRWLLVSAWVAIGYGLIQYLDGRFFKGMPQGLDPFIWRYAFGPRVFSTFGNPNFYGNFLVIITPIVLASVLKEKGSMLRVALVLGLIFALALTIDKMMLGLFGDVEPSLSIVFNALIFGLLCLFAYACAGRMGGRLTLASLLLLFALLCLNIYSTETKGAWMGFIAAFGITCFLIFEYFLHFEDHLVDPKKYFVFVVVMASLLAVVILLLAVTFVVPFFKGDVSQIGYQILWIPPLLFAIVSVCTVLWMLRKPWHLKKVIYGLLIFFMITMGGGVLQFAKKRLVSVSFRMFTWISTWEMVRTNPILGNGVGTFKIIYPAFRRPEIIVLEGRSNTETDHAEDEYIETWQDEGIIGFGIFLWMVVTALALGFKQLRWYSTHRSQDGPKAKKLLDADGNPRSYEVLGYLGAYIGALIHWCVDVSIRFVSSGIFSGFLPGILVAYARNHENPVPVEVRLPYDRWIRAALAAVWTCVLLWLGLELVPQAFIQNGDTSTGQIVFWTLLAGGALYLLIELVEIGNVPEKEIRFSEQYGEINPKGSIFRLAALPFLFVGALWLIRFSANQFWGDVHHNLAIFFSKEAIWMKSPVYDSKMLNLPPDIREKYQKTGGALEHYHEVVTLNHAFPMAHYFTGNVYNDWGSQINGESMNARQRGDIEEAVRLRQKSQDMWNKAEEAYTNTKKLAPNYVQTHHQMGLLFVKRAEQANAWGEAALAHEMYQKALAEFYRYKMLDPVFLANYDRIVQILLMDGKIDESIALYKEALYYNKDVEFKIKNAITLPDRVAAVSMSLAKLYFNEVAHLPSAFNPPVPQAEEAIKYFKLAVENDPKNVEAWKGLGFLLEKCGRNPEAQIAYQHALQLAPNDPDMKKK